jgi:hypothetical protein
VLAKAPATGAQEMARYSSLEKRIRAEGSKILSPQAVGKSGAVHSLGIVAQRKDGSKHGYLILRDAEEAQVMKLFVTQLDTDLIIHGLHGPDLSPSVKSLALAYSLDLQPWEDSDSSRAKG